MAGSIARQGRGLERTCSLNAPQAVGVRLAVSHDNLSRLRLVRGAGLGSDELDVVYITEFGRALSARAVLPERKILLSFIRTRPGWTRSWPIPGLVLLLGSLRRMRSLPLSSVDLDT